MHGRPSVPADKMKQDFSLFVRDYAFTPDSEIYFAESPAGEYAAQIWLHIIRNVFNRQLEMWIWDITVAEPFRRRGIGRALLDFAQSRAQERHCAELWLLVSSANAEALRLYKSEGMRAAGHLMMRGLTDRGLPPAVDMFHQIADIRPLRPSDLTSLYRLWDRASLPYRPHGRDREDQLARHLSAAAPGGWGSFAGETLACAAIVSQDGRKGWIERLATDPDFRRTGLAKAVIAAARQGLKEAGALVIGALIEAENTASIRLFEACDFKHNPNIGYFTWRENPDD
ncbi:GNAT family N-acetyltransferase [bacterium]|nr:GNAT family N-acetyltransferase [bacterium]MBU1983660.1 GNAT family N-acetyltransferase [bacterium]